MKLKRKSKTIVATILLLVIIAIIPFLINQNKNNNIAKANRQANIDALKVQSDKYLNDGDIDNALAMYRKIEGLENDATVQRNINDLVKIKGITNDINLVQTAKLAPIHEYEQTLIRCNEILDIKESKYFQTFKNDTETKIKSIDDLYAKLNIAKRDKVITKKDISIKSEDTNVEKEDLNIRKKEPYIGMTEKNLLLCLWGRPEDINTTTTTYGVSKQYCYSDYRFVYVKDGIVTTIQD
ncbi:hypothetical protein [Clostridium lacusfryxellense]|uniref:hypothetical protein n=1 Tax=Clostridium lacusfryxellense TaxID=205328 RepID=UPI001C0E223A|nr:hypothetical protein [Clostridium lacusfryxellense]MBU3114337.1 hypothetical protein [Clostridium lacusfryxellense]